MKIKILLFIISILFQGCGLYNKVSFYDEFTDKALMQLQIKTDDFITKLSDNYGSHEASFEKNETFYREIERDLKILEFRASAIPKNEITVDLLNKIHLSILGDSTEKGLKQIHSLLTNSEKGPDKITLNIQKRQINQVISNALKLEIEKKQLTKIK